MRLMAQSPIPSTSRACSMRLRLNGLLTFLILSSRLPTPIQCESRLPCKKRQARLIPNDNAEQTAFRNRRNSRGGGRVPAYRGKHVSDWTRSGPRSAAAELARARGHRARYAGVEPMDGRPCGVGADFMPGGGAQRRSDHNARCRLPGAFAKI